MKRLFRGLLWAGRAFAGALFGGESAASPTAAPGGAWRRSLRTWARVFRRAFGARSFARDLPTWARVWRYQPVSTTRIPPQTLTKTVSDERYFAADFSHCPEVVAGETLSAPELIPASVPGLTVGAPAVTVAAFDGTAAGKAVKFLVTGGTEDGVYNFAIRATTSGGARPVVPCRLVVTPDYDSQ